MLGLESKLAGCHEEIIILSYLPLDPQCLNLECQLGWESKVEAPEQQEAWWFPPQASLNKALLSVAMKSQEPGSQTFQFFQRLSILSIHPISAYIVSFKSPDL